MIITKEQQASFAQAAQPLMDWLDTNCHPHTQVIVTPTTSELTEALAMIRNPKYPMHDDSPCQAKPSPNVKVPKYPSLSEGYDPEASNT